MKLRVLCPQEYYGMEMQVIECDRCSAGWDRKKQRCNITTGAETIPTTTDAPPVCPIQDRCQHQLQATPGLCDVRRAGLICESALIYAGFENAADHPLSFHALMMA